MELIYSFWHRDPSELQAFRGPEGDPYFNYVGDYLWSQKLGPYTVRTWTNRDGKPICTGWFTYRGE